MSSTFALATMVLAAIATGSCSRDVSPTTPTADPAVVAPPPPPPAESPATLKGRVTEAAPTTVMGVWDSTVTLTDGTSSWSSEKTFGGAGQGLYSIPALRPGRYDATVSAAGFVTVTRSITIPSDAAMDFALLPIPATITDNFELQISDGDGTCSDGEQSRPCRIVAIPIHNAGPIDATLTWKSATPIALKITLFEKGQTTPLARSTTKGETMQNLAMTLAGGALYELRITYVSGIGPASYAMRVIHQN
jgi:Carboxypeptidase regulatory-like domain